MRFRLAAGTAHFTAYLAAASYSAASPAIIDAEEEELLYYRSGINAVPAAWTIYRYSAMVYGFKYFHFTLQGLDAPADLQCQTVWRFAGVQLDYAVGGGNI